jgi:hypothetical protein
VLCAGHMGLSNCSLPQFGHSPEKDFSVVSTFLQNHLGSGEGAAGKGCAAEVIATVSCNYVALSPRHALCIASRHGTGCDRATSHFMCLGLVDNAQVTQHRIKCEHNE